MGLISRVSSRTYRVKSTVIMLRIRQSARKIMTSAMRRGEVPYSLGYGVQPADNPTVMRLLNISCTLMLSVFFYRFYHNYFAIVNHGRGYISPQSLTNEQLGLPPQSELVRISHAIHFGVNSAEEAA